MNLDFLWRGMGVGLALVGAAVGAGAQTQASSCRTFVDSIGVNTHFAYYLDPNSIWYSGNFGQLTTVLSGLGVKHIRDGMIPAYANNASSGQSVEFHALAVYGIHADLIFDPSQGTVAAQEAALKVLNTGTAVVEAVEGPNEADLNSSFSYDGQAFPAGDAAFQSDLYTAVKGDAATLGLTVIGPSEGQTYSALYPTPPSQGGQPFANGQLYPSCDWGNCHPYTFGGNFASQVFSYETINSYFRQGQFPGCNIGVFPYTFTEYQPPFALYNGQGVQTTSRPMAATEKGYFNGSASESVSAVTFAKYIPRIFAEDFAKGFVRTYSYELMDEGTDLTNNQDNFGLVGHNFAPKPAYYALQNMISLLTDSGGTFTPGSLAYSVTVTPPAGYTQSTEVPDYYFNPATQAVDNVLLQKSNGTFELLIWNDISSSAIADTNGNALAGTARDLSPPAFPTVIGLPASIVSATIRSLNPDGTVTTSTGTITNGKLAVNVPDNVLIIDLNPAGSYGAWAAKYFTAQQLGSSTVSGPSAAPQNDGVSNLLKYACDIDPARTMTAADLAALPVGSRTTNAGQKYLCLTYRLNASLSGYHLNLQSSPDLLNWTTVTPDLSQQTGTDPGTGDPIMQVGVNVTNLSQEFLRLNVTSP